jgi:hypothetical protein
MGARVDILAFFWLFAKSGSASGNYEVGTDLAGSFKDHEIGDDNGDTIDN